MKKTGPMLCSDNDNADDNTSVVSMFRAFSIFTKH